MSRLNKYFLSLLMFNSICLMCCVEAETNAPIVTLKDGQVRGTVLKTLLDNRDFYAFRGIPYAKPPIGSLRFKAPSKIEPWQGILNATGYGEWCPQLALFTNQYIGNEDCLFINVFTPSLSESRQLSVIFYIHGGGYHSGGVRWNGPEILLDEDIVLVTFQYRLGPFGFMSLGTAEYSGNMGMKDQLLALKWVNENIHKFGGDKSSITIFGHSAGASSANLHMLSPQSRGLFQRAIISGGSVFNSFAYIPAIYNHTDLIRKYLTQLWKTTEEQIEEQSIPEWLVNIQSVDLIKDTFHDLYTAGLKSKRFESVWAPIVEKRNAIDPFLLEDPLVYLNEFRDVDSLFGYCSAEAAFFLTPEYKDPNLLNSFNEHFEIQSPLVGWVANTSAQEYPNYIKEIRQFYFGNRNVDASTLNEYTQLISDTFLTYAIDKAAREQAKRSTAHTYYFQFDLQTELNYFSQKSDAVNVGVDGSAHIEDLPYLFKTDLVPEFLYKNAKTSSIQENHIKRVRSFFVNFVKYGNFERTESWAKLKPISGDSFDFALIDNSHPDGIRENPHQNVIAFWTQLLSKYQHIFIQKY